MNKTIVTIGDISTIKFWLSIELRPTYGLSFKFGRTYGGTNHGLVICFGFGMLIAHIR